MNVIVIITDSLRRDHLSCYGNPWIKTPTAERFAKESVVFNNAYSEGLPTMPTRTAWWTGRFTFPFRGWQQFEHDDVLLAEVLWDKGFTSALITDVYHMHKPRMNCGRGFDHVEWIRGQEYDPFIVGDIPVEIDRYYHPNGQTDHIWKPNLIQYLKNVSIRKTEEDYFVAQCVKAAIRWLERQKGKDRLFLWLDCFDPHEPWDAPEPFRSMYNPGYKGKEIIDPVPWTTAGYLNDEELKEVRSLYAGEVSFVDRWVGLFLDACRALGYLDNSLIIWTSDHGEPLGEHGIVRKCRPWLHEVLVKIPLLARYPGGAFAGRRVEAQVETCDLMPTVLSFFGIAAPQGMHGRDMSLLVRGQEEKLRDYAYSGFFEQSWSVRDDRYSLLLSLAEPGQPAQLFDREKDPLELVDIAPQDPERARFLERELRKWVDEITYR